MEPARNQAVRRALAPIGHHPVAAAALGDLDTHGYVTHATVQQLVDDRGHRDDAETILMDLAVCLLGYGERRSRAAHPDQALRYLSGDHLRAYVDALAAIADAEAPTPTG